MLRIRKVLTTPLLAALAAVAFCVWSVLGNDVNFCVTAGCTLYQDFTVGGVSLWWIGTGVFIFMALLALLGLAGPGLFFSGCALVGDTLLLLLLAATAPCILCLLVAIFFAICYRGFRQASAMDARLGRPAVNSGRSLLLIVWAVLFIINVGAVIRSQSSVWPILGEEEDAQVRLFFSPSCPSCRQAVEALSGNVEVAFYPLAEGEIDVHKTAKMQTLLEAGMSIADALAESQAETVSASLKDKLDPDLWLLRLRLLRNKAHIFTAGSTKVPFLEYRGLPSILTKSQGGRNTSSRNGARSPQPDSGALPAEENLKGAPGASSIALPTENLDPTLPIDPVIAGQCSGNKPCP